MSVIAYWQDDETGQTESVQFDAVKSESPEDALDITEHPVEEGANVSDNARLQPTRLSLEGYVSTIANPAVDTDAVYDRIVLSVPIIADPGSKKIKLDVPSPPVQLSESGLLQAGIGAISNAITGGPNYNAQVRGDINRSTLSLSAQALQLSSPRNRVRDFYDLLLKAQSRKLLVTVSTRFRDYFDLLIERVAAPRTADDGDKILFQLDLKQVRIAASETVTSPEPAELRGQLPQAKGSQNPKEVPPTDAEAFRSGLRSIRLAFFGGGQDGGI